MKKFVLVLLMVSLYTAGYSFNERLKLGIFASPGVSWMKPMGSEIQHGVAGFGLMYGLKIDYYFKDQNYAFSTGIFGGVDGNGLHGRDTLTNLNSGHPITEHYITNEVILPLYLKLKTNPFKQKFRLYAEIGALFVFDVTARATFSSAIPSANPGNPLIDVDKENVLRNNNEVQQLIPNFRYFPFDIRLSAGGGVEYEAGRTTSVFFAIHYNNGFIPVIEDKSVNPKHDATVIRSVLLSVGVMF